MIESLRAEQIRLRMAQIRTDLGDDVDEIVEQARVMADFPIGDVWGIGPASQVKLGALGIKYAGEVRNMDPKLARQIMTVVGERVWTLRSDPVHQAASYFL